MTLAGLRETDRTNAGGGAGHVTVRYGDAPALEDISFMSSGERIAVVGPNGAGKSIALLKLVVGIQAPTTAREIYGLCAPYLHRICASTFARRRKPSHGVRRGDDGP